MLDTGAIWPSQSVWCNTVVLVRKKDGGLCFCIGFCHLNAHTKKDSYSLLRIQEAIESLVGAGHFSCLDLKSGVLADKNGGGIKTVYCLYGRQFGVFEMWPHALWAMQHARATFQQLMQHCLEQIKPHLLPHLLRWHNHILTDSRRASPPVVHVVFNQFREYNLKLKPPKCSLFKEGINYLVHLVSKKDVWPSDLNLKVITHCALPQTYMEMHAFLSLVGHYRWFLKGYVHALHNHWMNT